MITLEMFLSEEFLRNNREVFGAEGLTWLERLPDIIADYERLWSLDVDQPFAGLTYNFAAPARRSDGTELVLKIGVPRTELEHEIDALRHYDGRGSVRFCTSLFGAWRKSPLKILLTRNLYIIQLNIKKRS